VLHAEPFHSLNNFGEKEMPTLKSSAILTKINLEIQSWSPICNPGKGPI